MRRCECRVDGVLGPFTPVGDSCSYPPTMPAPPKECGAVGCRDGIRANADAPKPWCRAGYRPGYGVGTMVPRVPGLSRPAAVSLGGWAGFVTGTLIQARQRVTETGVCFVCVCAAVCISGGQPVSVREWCHHRGGMWSVCVQVPFFVRKYAGKLTCA